MNNDTRDTIKKSIAFSCESMKLCFLSVVLGRLTGCIGRLPVADGVVAEESDILYNRHVEIPINEDGYRLVGVTNGTKKRIVFRLLQLVPADYGVLGRVPHEFEYLNELHTRKLT